MEGQYTVLQSSVFVSSVSDGITVVWGGFADIESGVERYEVGIGKSVCGNDDMVSFRDVGLSVRWGLSESGLAMIDLVTSAASGVFVGVRAWNAAGGSTVSCLRLEVDMTPPSGGHVNDGWTTENPSAYGRDPHRPDWCASRARLGLPLEADCDPVGCDRYRMDSCAASLGSRYVECATGACIPRPSCDETPAHCDCLRMDFDCPRSYQASTVSIEVAWSGVSDGESGVVEYEWAVGRGPMPKQQVQAFVSVGTTTSGVCTTGGCQHLETGVVYVVTVRAWNGAALFTDIQSHGVYVDAIAPRAGRVSDGVVADVDTDWQASTVTVSCSWSGFSDAHSGIARMEVAVGTSEHGTNVRGYSDVGLVTTADVTGLSLTSGTRYYVSVRAVDMAGNTADACSDGITVDASAPSSGQVVMEGQYTVLQSSVFVSSVSDGITVVWGGFADIESGVERYEVGIGKSVCGNDDMVSFRDVGLSVRWGLSESGLAMIDLVTSAASGVFVGVRAWNAAGGSTVSCLRLEVDMTPPSGGHVNDGWTTENPSAYGRDPHRPDWCASRARLGLPLEADCDPVGCDRYRMDSCAASLGSRYVECATGACIPRPSCDETPAHCDCLRMDFDCPRSYQASTVSIEVAWSGVSDGESGVVEYEWAVGRGPMPKQQVQAFVSVGTTTSGVCTTGGCQHLETGVVYVVTVRAWNGAALFTDIQSHGVYVDAIAPRAGRVSDGVVADVDTDWQASTVTVSCSWSGFSDAHSGIARMEVAVGTSEHGTNVRGYSDVGLVTTADVTGLSLTSGTRYYVSVRAVDMAGNTADACSDGITVDASAPVSGFVQDGRARADAAVQVSQDQVSARWRGFADGQSRIERYEWAFGTTAGGTDLQAFVSVGVDTEAVARDLALELGTTVYVTVRATNPLGMSATAHSSGSVVAPASLAAPISVVPVRPPEPALAPPPAAPPSCTDATACTCAVPYGGPACDAVAPQPDGYYCGWAGAVAAGALCWSGECRCAAGAASGSTCCCGGTC